MTRLEANAAATVRDAIDRAARQLAAAGIEEPRRDARLLLADALGVGQGALLTADDRPIDARAAARFAAHVARRAAREPVSRILGVREFWSLPFRLTPATLDPRPDSETLIEAALAAVPDRAAPLRLLDLGTGSGCLLLALLSELPQATGLGVDNDSAALAVAAENARALGFAARAEFRRGDWGHGLAERFDLVVANPPYIAEGDIAGLAPEVALHEPRGALAGGVDGLDAYRLLAPQLAGLLRDGGSAVLEFGRGQSHDVEGLLTAESLEIRGFRGDLGGTVRCVVAACGSAKK